MDEEIIDVTNHHNWSRFSGGTDSGVTMRKAQGSGLLFGGEAVR